MASQKPHQPNNTRAAHSESVSLWHTITHNRKHQRQASLHKHTYTCTPRARGKLARLNGKTSGSAHGHLGRRTSSARSDGDLQERCTNNQQPEYDIASLYMVSFYSFVTKACARRPGSRKRGASRSDTPGLRAHAHSLSATRAMHFAKRPHADVTIRTSHWHAMHKKGQGFESNTSTTKILPVARPHQSK